MRLTTVAAAAVAAQGVSAFRDTSSFFFFSSSRLSDSTATLKASDDIATALVIKEHVSAMLHECPSDTYLVVNQPGALASDFADEASAPYLRRKLAGEDPSVQSRQVISSVVGDLAATHFTSELSKHCNADVVALDGQRLPKSTAAVPQILTIDLPRLSTASPQREADLSKNDAYLNAVISSLPSEKYTVMFRTTPSQSQHYAPGSGDSRQERLYDMDEQYPSTVHANNFKRDVDAYPRAANGSGNLDSNLPLFEKYQFFNPALFMGLSVALLLLTILYVAISAVSGLEVSYYAFSKEFNPASQRKQQ